MLLTLNVTAPGTVTRACSLTLADIVVVWLVSGSVTVVCAAAADDSASASIPATHRLGGRMFISRWFLLWWLRPAGLELPGHGQRVCPGALHRRFRAERQLKTGRRTRRDIRVAGGDERIRGAAQRSVVAHGVHPRAGAAAGGAPRHVAGRPRGRTGDRRRERRRVRDERDGQLLGRRREHDVLDRDRLSGGVGTSGNVGDIEGDARRKRDRRLFADAC